MEWFNAVKGTVKKTAGIAYEKSSQLVELTKIKYKIYEAEAGIDKFYVELGTKIYDSYKSGEELPEEVRSICESIDNKYFEIETLKSQIEEIKDVQICKSCNAKSPADAKFCLHCGEKIDN